MSTLNEVVADCVESVIGLGKVDVETLHFNYKGRKFRALVHGDHNVLQIGDSDFDRWANSVGGAVYPCPLTTESMDLAIKFLLSLDV